jgi:predicted metalloprotease
MMAGGGLGTLVLIVIVLLLGGDPQALLNQQGPVPQPGQQAPLNPEEEELKQFVATVLASTEDVWSTLFESMDRKYREPKLVLFSGEVRSACGFANAAVGPFYCPADEKAYIDLSFYQQLRDRFHAPGDFAQAYVIAHEIGHHVQNLLGISERVHREQQRLSESESNQLSVRLELQADFFAGVWAHHAQKMERILESGDIEEGLRAASAIGDDQLQKQSRGYVVPDSFTHGSSEQRVRWFRRGLETGDLSKGDTFSAESL